MGEENGKRRWGIGEKEKDTAKRNRIELGFTKREGGGGKGWGVREVFKWVAHVLDQIDSCDLNIV